MGVHTHVAVLCVMPHIGPPCAGFSTVSYDDAYLLKATMRDADSVIEIGVKRKNAFLNFSIINCGHVSSCKTRRPEAPCGIPHMKTPCARFFMVSYKHAYLLYGTPRYVA